MRLLHKHQIHREGAKDAKKTRGKLRALPSTAAAQGQVWRLRGEIRVLSVESYIDEKTGSGQQSVSQWRFNPSRVGGAFSHAGGPGCDTHLIINLSVLEFPSLTDNQSPLRAPNGYG